MQRRDVLRNVATAGAIVTGAASVASATRSDDDLYVVREENGERVVQPLSETDDVEVQDHCHTYCCEDCPNTGCGDSCVCEDYCHM